MLHFSECLGKKKYATTCHVDYFNMQYVTDDVFTSIHIEKYESVTRDKIRDEK